MRITLSETNPYLVSLHPQAKIPTLHNDPYTDGLFDDAKKKAKELYERGKKAVNDAKDKVNQMAKKKSDQDDDGKKEENSP